MGQGPEELRRDIERRRDDLGETIDAIGDRVSPGRILERRRNRISDGWHSISDRVMGTVSTGTDRLGDAAGSVKDHVSGDAIRTQTAGAPLGAGLVAFGVGFLVAAALPASEPEQAAASRAQDALEPARAAVADAGQQLARDVKDDVAAAAGELKETATDATSDVTAAAKEQADGIKADARSATD